MSAGLQDLVDCVRLAREATIVERVYELANLARLKDVLADARGSLSANFAFAKLPSGRPGVTVTVRATPELVCQRCMLGFGFNVIGCSEIEFAAGDDAEQSDSEREFYRMQGGLVSLSDLAEEELLLALPIAPACTIPLTCGKAPGYATGDETRDSVGDMRRPFSALQDLLKKT